ncbi:winged helix-turn-helix domain-containing protein [Streptomyces europaeiscabiei]|uniref:helix-turn-helix transcriptional regulator n=1 Tax=Streptomyces europaeiscabiei TaxID=146819 RepID=UPI0030E4D18E
MDLDDPVAAPTAERESQGLRRELKEWASVLDRESGDGKVLGDHKICDRWTAAVSRWAIDASLLGDAENLHIGLETLRSAHVRLPATGETVRAEAHVAAMMETVRAALDRARQAELEDTLDPSTRAAKILTLIYETPGITSTEIREELDTGESQVSRSGRALAERGLVIKTRHGQERRWRTTPRGAVAARKLQHRSPARQHA